MYVLALVKRLHRAFLLFGSTIASTVQMSRENSKIGMFLKEKGDGESKEIATTGIE